MDLNHNADMIDYKALRTNYIESNIEEDIELKINLELKIYLIRYPYEKQHQRIMLIINLTILVY